MAAATVATVFGAAGLSACGGGAAAAPRVADHVHGAVAGNQSGQIVLATHYGLELSHNGGQSWQPDAGLGEEMVAGIVKLPSDYVASLQPMAGMKMPRMTAADDSMPGMSMGAASTPNLGYSSNAQRWYAAEGIPAGASVASLVSSGPTTVWASLIGLGLYESTDAGQQWTKVLPATVPISSMLVMGDNLLLVTPGGLFATTTFDPIMPGLAQLDQPVNDLTSLPGCSTCAIAALGSGGVAITHDDGISWDAVPFTPTFDELYAPAGTGAVFGMVPSSADPNHGIWRSADGGKTWTKVLTADLVDHMYAANATAGDAPELLAFQWGINVFDSTNDGVTWTPITRIGPP